jgi:hypothetical protein
MDEWLILADEACFKDKYHPVVSGRPTGRPLLASGFNIVLSNAFIFRQQCIALMFAHWYNIRYNSQNCHN